MNNYQRLTLILGTLLILTIGLSALSITKQQEQLFGYVEPTTVDIFQGKQSDSLILESFKPNTYFSVYQEYNIITLVPKGDMYMVISEVSTYPIGIFTYEDTKSLLFWILEYPMDDDEDGIYSNNYYQSLIEEKLWE